MSLTVNSDAYYQNIRNKLHYFITLANGDSRINFQSLNLHAEDFYVEFLNMLRDWELVNANVIRQNTPGIDLIDKTNKIIAQVSSNHKRDKLQDALTSADCAQYAGYHFYFVVIADRATNYTKPFDPLNYIAFDLTQDVYDEDRLKTLVKSAGIEKQKALSELMDKYFGTEKIATKGEYLTAPPAFADTSSVICRDVELSKIKEKLKRGENILLMSGFGGIGKTALARLVFHTVRENYDQVAWIHYNKNLQESMLSSILGLMGNNPEERWDEIQHILNNGASKLIVIDNADRDEKSGQSPEDDTLLQTITGYPNTTVLLTSRLEAIYDYKYYEVGFLSKDACVELFYKHYANDPERAQQDVVKDLAKLAKYHTLTIELIAKGARRETNLRAYYNKLKKSFANATLKVRSGHNDKYTTIKEHLKVLFDISGRTDGEKAALWDFAVLPAGAALSPEETELWFQHDPNLLDQLQQDGWMMWIDGRYAMHPLVKEILHLDPIPKNTAEKFLAFVEDVDNEYFSDNDVHTERDRKLALAESVVAAVCPEDTLQLANILHNMGYAYEQAGQYPRAEAHYLRAVKISEDQLGEDHPSTATTYNNIANVYYAKGDLDKALTFYEKALAIREAKLGKDHTRTATTYNNIAGVYQDMGDPDKALEFHEKALAIVKDKLGKDHPHTAATYNNIALVYDNMGDLDKALEFYEKALAIKEAKLGEDHPHTATTYNNIAEVYRAKGDLDKALEFYEKALPIVKSKLGEDHPHTASTYNNIATVYRAMGDPDKALEFFEKALAISEAKLGEDHPLTATTYHNIGTVYYAKEDYAMAKGYLLRALRIFLRKLGPGHPNVKATMGWLFGCHNAEGNALEAFFPWLMGQLSEDE